MSKTLVPQHTAPISENQIAYLNREPAAFAKNTYVIFPKQECHGAHYKVGKNEGYAPSLYALVLDENRNVIKEQVISRSQLNKMSFGINVDSVRRVEDSQGRMKGELTANVSNISGIKPRWGYVINKKDSSKCWALAEPFAVRVGESHLHSFPVLEQNGDKWEYQADDSNSDYCKLEKRNLPELVTQAPASVKADATLPSDWTEFAIGDREIFTSAE